MELNNEVEKALREIREMQEIREPYSNMAVMAKVAAAVNRPNSMFDAFSKVDALVDKLKPLTPPAWMDDFQRNKGLISAIADMNAHIDRIKPLDTIAWLEKNHPVWANPAIGNWSDNLWKIDAVNSIIRNDLKHLELYNGITFSIGGVNLRMMNSLHEALGAKLDLDNSFGVELDSSYGKVSRFINSYLQRQQKIYTVDYDLSACAEADELEDENLVLPEQIITPASLRKGAQKVRDIIHEIYRNNHHLFKIHHNEFEKIIAEMLEKRGYVVELTKKTRDGGRDIIAIRDDNGMPLKYLVECKHNRKDRKIGIGVIRSFSDVLREEYANKGIIFTTSYFTKDAWKRQKATPYLLDYKDHDDVISWIKDYMLRF